MKLTSCLKPLGLGVVAFSAAIALQHPVEARPKVTVTTTPGNSGATVVPVVPAVPGGAITPAPGGPPPGGLICVPGAPTPCAQPQPIAKDYFFCGRGSNGLPTTFVNTPSGNIPLVRWVSHFFEHSGYSPEVRCQDVSQRFNRFYNQGILNFVTTGIVNNQPVVCVAGRMGGPCTGVLFTLKPGQSATRTIQQLFDVRAGAAGPLFESEERIYVDMRPYTSAIQANR
ncbi:MAG: COP23 domain-containing protein [Leptolyngbyaceae cyanobacterium bins.349]|nr:COP23 domain-containing protein [Leptolyngbyaceae cyanobacterium bins.349]